MQRSADRILTTHAGSLPRPAELDDAFERRATDETGYARALQQAVDSVVKRQLEFASTSSTTANSASPAGPAT
jgi:5-methyltetrahydropteroyltriglutamate--homocysteine methyltransferase